jgi:hypothetical protein
MEGFCSSIVPIMDLPAGGLHAARHDPLRKLIPPE